VPQSLDRIVRRAMHKEKEKRYASGDEFAEDLLEARRAGLGAAAQEFSDADKFAALRAMRFFSRFADPELWEVIRIGIWERVAAATEVIREGEGGDFFCVVVDGEVRVTKNKKLLSVLGPGECFGEMAYLSTRGHERGATVTAARDARIVRVRVADLEQATVACRAKFDRAFVGILVERLNLANSRLASG
jgi:CRP-like cAMP-binding protein